MIDRRDFLKGLTAVGTGTFLDPRMARAGAEPPPETTRLRMLQFPTSICQAPLYVTDELLRAEGFTDINFVRTEGGIAARNLVRGEVDIGMNFIAPNLVRIEAGDPVVILAGVHIGCFELLGTERVRAIRDLKGKRVALGFGLDGPDHVFISTMASYVGLNPQREITWVVYDREPVASAVEAFATGQVDAFMAFPPVAQELRSRKIGQLVVNGVTDRPWSQYFCCMVIAHRDFVRRHPVATKRAVRAILKGIDLCALQPERAARTLVNQGFTDRYDYALQTMKELPYGKWREYDPADSVRFYALRLHEAGMIKSNPQKILAQGTDWRFLNELKKELKG